MCSAFYVPVRLNYLPFLPHPTLSGLLPFDRTNSSARITPLHYFITCISVQILPIYQSPAQMLIHFENYLLFLSAGGDIPLVHAQ